MQLSQEKKLGQLRALIFQIGYTKSGTLDFGLRSLRSGGAGQTLIMILSGQGGIPRTSFLQAIARMLGHVTMTIETLQSYIGPLAKQIIENGRVVLGVGEGAGDARVDYEARIASLVEYVKFANVRLMNAAELATEAETRATRTFPPLPPGISALVDLDTAVMSSLKVRDREVQVLRRMLRRDVMIEKADGAQNVPSLLCVEGGRIDKEGVKEDICCFNEAHTLVRGKTVDRIRREMVLALGPEAQGVKVLRFSPDLLRDAPGFLHWYEAKREASGEYTMYIKSICA